MKVKQRELVIGDRVKLMRVPRRVSIPEVPILGSVLHINKATACAVVDLDRIVNVAIGRGWRVPEAATLWVPLKDLRLLE